MQNIKKLRLGGSLVVMTVVAFGFSMISEASFSLDSLGNNLDINATVALSCDNTVTMQPIVGTGKSTIALSGGKATNNVAQCNVKTNSSGGFVLQWNASSTVEASGAMKNATNDVIDPYSLSASSETWSVPVNVSEWGAKLGSSSEGYGTGDAGGDYSYTSAGGWGSDDGYTAGKWMNVPTSPFQIMQKSTETDVDGEYQYLVFGAQIGHDKIQPTGTYTQEVTVTALTVDGSGGGGGGGGGGVDGNGCVYHNAEYGDTIDGDIDVTDCESSPRGPGYYTEKIVFSGSTGDAIIATATWPDFDGYLYLTDESDTIIADNDDFEGVGNSRIIFELPADGTYHLWMTTFDSGDTGSYSVTIGLQVCTSYGIAYGETKNRTLDSGDCQTNPAGDYAEYATFTATAGDIIRATLDYESGDNYLVLTDDSNTEITNDWGFSEDSVINYTIPTSGTYRLWAASYLPSLPVNYTLTLIKPLACSIGGTEYAFNAASTGLYQGTQVGLDSSRFVVAFIDSADSDKKKAVIGTESAGSITYGSEYEFDPTFPYPSSMDNLATVKMDSSHFAVAYHGGYGGPLRVVIGSVSGNNIAFGGPIEVESEAYMPGGVSAPEFLTALDASHLVVAYATTDPNLKVSVVSSGGVVSSASSGYSNPGYWSVSGLDSSHFALVTDSGVQFGTSIGGGAPTFGSHHGYGYSIERVRSFTLDSTKLVVAGLSWGHSGSGVVGIASVNATGDTITFGTFELLSGSDINYYTLIYPRALSSDRIVIVYDNHDESYSPYCLPASVSGTSLTLGVGSVIPNATDWFNTWSPVVLDNDTIITPYVKSNSQGYSRVGTVN